MLEEYEGERFTRLVIIRTPRLDLGVHSSFVADVEAAYLSCDYGACRHCEIVGTLCCCVIPSSLLEPEPLDHCAFECI